MKQTASISLILLASLVCVAGESGAPDGSTKPTLSRLRAQGLEIVNDRGDPVLLRGFNLGAWLLLEPWMVKLKGQEGIESEKDVWDQLAGRFGDAKMRELIRAYRQHFIQESDIDQLHRLGVNFVRLPIWWRVLGDTRYDPNGWEYVDRLLDWCEPRGIHVLLDLHGAPGGQNTGADILGERPDGTYWATNSAHRVATVELWKRIARRYVERPVVAGYDLLNEAWAAPNVRALIDHMDEIHRAIREIDSDHMVFIQDALQGYYRLPHPADMGWTNVVYSFHFYPGNGAQFARRELAGVRAAQLQYGVPVHMGEFNIFSIDRGGISALERSLEVFNAYGWSWNLWSYKVIEDNADYSWGMTGYTNARMPDVSLKTSSFEEIKRYLERTATSNWGANDGIRQCVQRRLAPLPAQRVSHEILRPEDAILLPRDESNGLHVEWQWGDRNLGFWGPNDSAAWKTVAPKGGPCSLLLQYAAAENPPQLEVLIDGVVRSQATLPTTPGWDQYANAIIDCGLLSQGEHVLRLRPSGGRSFLNLRTAKLIYSVGAETKPVRDRIELTPAEVSALKRTKHLCVEWQRSPPNFGYWSQGESLVFRFHLPRSGSYRASFEWASPNDDVSMQITVNGATSAPFALVATGDWQAFEWQSPSKRFTLPAGDVELTLTAVKIGTESDAGNLRTIRLEADE